MSDYHFVCNNGREVKIGFDASTFTATITTPTGESVGTFEFHEYATGKLCLVWADFNDSEYRRQGIGRECLRLMIDRFRMPLVVSMADGVSPKTKDGGSDFLKKMRQEGLIYYVGEPLPSDRELDE